MDLFRKKHIPQTRVLTISDDERERKRERVRLGDITGLGCMDWVISLANEWEDYSNYLGDGAEVSSPSFAL